MFCPNCAAQNADEAVYCRSCGTNLGAVRQALLAPQEVLQQGYGQDFPSSRNRRSSLEKGITEIFVGIAFIVVAFSVLRYAPAGGLWWFWMFIPAFGALGRGVSQLLASSRRDAARSAAIAAGSRQRMFPGRDQSNAIPPPSVTEGTTRTLNVQRRREE